MCSICLCECHIKDKHVIHHNFSCCEHQQLKYLEENDFGDVIIEHTIYYPTKETYFLCYRIDKTKIEEYNEKHN